MLKAHQACIDLEQNVLRIKGRTVPFLPEHELPENARLDHAQEQEPSTPSTSASASIPNSNRQPTPAAPSPAPRFPGAGNTIGSGNPSQPSSSRGTPSNAAAGARSQGRGTPNAGPSPFPEKDIQLIMGLGVTREIAISTLHAAGGNVDVAASLLF